MTQPSGRATYPYAIKKCIFMCLYRVRELTIRISTNESTLSEVIWTNESAPLCLKSVQGPDVVQTGHTGRESTMQAED